MGLMSVVKDTITGVITDQWKEYFYCDALPDDVLVVRGKKRVSEKSHNTVNDNIISSGSIVCIADGQCMIIVDNGEIAELCAEPGEFVYDSSSEASLLDGGKLGSNIKAVFATLGKRLTFGGEIPKDQRVYYFNVKEILDNKYGTPAPVPYRVVDQRAGIDIDISISCFGTYSYKIANPMLFYKNVCGNVTKNYTKDLIDKQLKSEVLNALQPAFAKVSDEGIRYSALPGKTEEISEALRVELSEKWGNIRGIELVSLSVSSVKANADDEQMIKDMQKEAAYTNEALGKAHYLNAQAEALKAAANNAAGANVGFMNLNMAQNAGANVNDLFTNNQQVQQQLVEPQKQVEQPAPQATADSWICPNCGSTVSGKFCTECGSKKPEVKKIMGWVCPNCNTTNTGKFCMECGTKKPVKVLKYRCDKCGWETDQVDNPPKFCPECGDRITEADQVTE